MPLNSRHRSGPLPSNGPLPTMVSCACGPLPMHCPFTSSGLRSDRRHA